jgi:hypothetical protein
MLLAGWSFKGLMIEADDGRIGAFSNFLFDDRTWKLRWTVLDAGNLAAGPQGPGASIRHRPG